VEFKREAVQHTKRAGSSIAQVAKDLEMGGRWINKFDSGNWESSQTQALAVYTIFRAFCLASRFSGSPSTRYRMFCAHANR
jgi:transposase-like protein